MSRPLRSVADVYYGKSPAAVVTDESEILVFGTGGDYARASEALFAGPAVVVPRKGSLGNPQYVPGPFWASDTTYAVLPKPNVDARWLFYSLDSFDLTKLNEATGVPSISRDWLYKVPVGDHNPSDQRRIAEILSTVDEAIEQTEALIAKTQQIKTGLMHDLFTRGVTPDGRLRPPRDQAPDLYKQAPLGWIPREWAIERLGNLSRVIRGASPRPKGDPCYYGGDVPRLMVEDVTRDGKWVTPQVDFLTELGASLSRPVPPGTLTLVCSGTVGVPALLAIAACIHDGFLALTHIAPRCNTDFLYHGFLSSRQRLEGRATHGGVFTNLTTSIVKTFEVPLPPLLEQSMICQRLNALSGALDAERQMAARLLSTKIGLMNDLLSCGDTTPAIAPKRSTAVTINTCNCP
jgi:type I restriction enzyme S subunit